MPVRYAVRRCVPAHPRHYRYWLEVQLAERGPRLAVILKNPSTATAQRSDPTLGKVSAWARRNGFGSVVIVNLFAYRATQPAALNAVPYARAVGLENDAYVLRAAQSADVVVAAWGNPNGIEPERYARRVAEVPALLRDCDLHHIGSTTALGHPRHGLFWPRHAGLLPFEHPAKTFN